MPGNRWKSTIFLCVLWVLSACEPIDTLNALSLTNGYRVKQAVPFGPEYRHKLDIYMPKTPDPQRSIVVFYYGGAWKSGRREDYAFIGKALTDKGFYVVIPDYRLHPTVNYPAFLEDSARAVAWVHENAASFGGNKNRIFVMGHSAGAYNALMLAVDARWLGDFDGETSWIKGAIGISGPYDFLPIQDPSVQRIFATAIDLRTTQPIYHVAAGAPPVLLFTGDDDGQVDPQNSRHLVEKLKEGGNDAELVVYPRIGHREIVLELSPLANGTGMKDRVARFIKAH